MPTCHDALKLQSVKLTTVTERLQYSDNIEKKCEGKIWRDEGKRKGGVCISMK